MSLTCMRHEIVSDIEISLIHYEGPEGVDPHVVDSLQGRPPYWVELTPSLRDGEGWAESLVFAETFEEASLVFEDRKGEVELKRDAYDRKVETTDFAMDAASVADGIQRKLARIGYQYAGGDWPPPEADVFGWCHLHTPGWSFYQGYPWPSLWLFASREHYDAFVKEWVE